MPGSAWQEALELVEPYVVRISTPEGSGTGFLFVYSQDRAGCGVATAAHVVSHAHTWQQPIRIQHYKSGNAVFLKEEDRAILVNSKFDTAAIVFSKRDLPFPDTLLPLMPEGKRLMQGVEIAWAGFPAVSPQNLCFFSGRVSAYLDEAGMYLVDGVAINGVSGGPAFTTAVSEGVTLCGLISAYLPNMATGEPLPGLCMAADVLVLQQIIAAVASVDEAKEHEGPRSADSSTQHSPSGA